MKKKKTEIKKVKMRGLYTPRILLFVHGFLDGRFKGAVLDSEKNVLNSAYVHDKIFQYNEFLEKNLMSLENEMQEIRTEAECIIQELWEIENRINGKKEVVFYNCAKKKIPATITEAQQLRKEAREEEKENENTRQKYDKYNELIDRKRIIIQRLIEIENDRAAKESVTEKNMISGAEALKASLCSYCHGAILNPVYENYIPQIDCLLQMKKYKEEHKKAAEKISDILCKEEMLYV